MTPDSTLSLELDSLIYLWSSVHLQHHFALLCSKLMKSLTAERPGDVVLTKVTLKPSDL